MLLRYGDAGSERPGVLEADGRLRDLSAFLTLHPSHIVATGTPAGVGLGQKPPVFLKTGDRVSLGIEGGGHHQSVTAPRAK